MATNPATDTPNPNRRQAAEHLKEASGLLVQAMRDVLLDPKNARALVDGAIAAAEHRMAEARRLMEA